MRLAFLLGLALLAAAHQAVAQAADPEQQIKIAEEAAGTQQPARSQPLVSTWDFVRMVAVLAGVVGSIYLLFFLLRRAGAPAHADSNLIRILGYRPLAGSRGLYLVEVGESIYLVGASDAQVSLVAEITEKASLDAVRLAAAQTPEKTTAKRSFANMLGAFFAPAARGLGTQDALGFLRRQKDRLRRM